MELTAIMPSIDEEFMSGLVDYISIDNLYLAEMNDDIEEWQQ